jgi:hypothetical protein
MRLSVRGGEYGSRPASFGAEAICKHWPPTALAIDFGQRSFALADAGVKAFISFVR